MCVAPTRDTPEETFTSIFLFAVTSICRLFKVENALLEVMIDWRHFVHNSVKVEDSGIRDHGASGYCSHDGR